MSKKREKVSVEESDINRMAEEGGKDFPTSEKQVEKKEEFPKFMQDALATLAKNPEVAGLATSLGAIATGAALIFDDYKDFGKDGTERDPPMPHHWLYGALTLIGGVAGTCVSGLALLKKLPKSQRVQSEETKRLPPSVLEGAPPELIQKYT